MGESDGLLEEDKKEPEWMLGTYYSGPDKKRVDDKLSRIPALTGPIVLLAVQMNKLGILIKYVPPKESLQPNML